MCIVEAEQYRGGFISFFLLSHLFLQKCWQSGEGGNDLLRAPFVISVCHFDVRSSKDNCNSDQIVWDGPGNKLGLVRKCSRERQHTNLLSNYLPFLISKNEYRNYVNQIQFGENFLMMPSSWRGDYLILGNFYFSTAVVLVRMAIYFSDNILL